MPLFTAYLTWTEPVRMLLSAYDPDGQLRGSVEAATSPLVLEMRGRNEGEWRFEITPMDAAQGPPHILVVYAPAGVVSSGTLAAIVTVFLAVVLVIALVWSRKRRRTANPRGEGEPRSRPRTP